MAKKQTPQSKHFRKFEVHDAGYAYSWHIGPLEDRIISEGEGHEPALPDLEKSLLALTPIFMRFSELPKKYITDKKLRVNRVYVFYNKHDARSVKLDATVTLKGGAVWNLRSIQFRIDEPLDGEKNVQIEVEPADVDTILDFCENAIDYIEGTRGQGTMLDDPEPDPEQGELGGGELA